MTRFLAKPIRYCRHRIWDYHLITFETLSREDESVTIYNGVKLYFDSPQFIRLYKVDVHARIDRWFTDLAQVEGTNQSEWVETTEIYLSRFLKRFVVAGIVEKGTRERKREKKYLLFTFHVDGSPMLKEWKNFCKLGCCVK